MKIGPKYKIARRLGAPVFEKTQSPKYTLSQSRKEKGGTAFRRPKSNFGLQLLEKQKARYTYYLTERQFSKYVKEAIAKKDKNASGRLYESLEMRADNAVFRAGLAPSRLSGRQMVSHGHITVNGKKITVPSQRLKIGDVIGIRAGSAGSPLFQNMKERQENLAVPGWIKFDEKKNTAEVISAPRLEGAEMLFDINAILEFYSR